MPENKRSILPPWPSYLFTLIALVALVTLVRVNSMADTATQQVSVTPEAPTIDTVTLVDSGNVDLLSNPFVPIEGGINMVTLHGQVSDANGCSDINNVTAVLHRSGYDYTQGDAEVKCYSAAIPKVVLEGCTGGDDTTAEYTMNLPFTNFVDPTDPGSDFEAQNWTVRISVQDESNPAVVDTSRSFEVNSLSAFSTANSIDYGTVALAADSTEKTVTFSNTGNRRVDTTIVADNDMTEPSGNFAVIPVGNVHYSATSSFVYAEGTPVSKTAAATFAIHLPQQIVDNGPGTTPTVDTYWMLRMPASGVNGSYSNTLTLTATPY
ncbi:MAG: hypothetical protein WC551_02180 [Patescibacteria group bacterium]